MALQCPPEFESATGTFDPSGYDGNTCAGCGTVKARHTTEEIQCQMCDAVSDGDNSNSPAFYWCDCCDMEFCQACWDKHQVGTHKDGCKNRA